MTRERVALLTLGLRSELRPRSNMAAFEAVA